MSINQMIMKAMLRDTGTITSNCPECGVPTNFVNRTLIDIEGGYSHQNKQYRRLLYGIHQCAGCKTGGLSKICDDGGWSSAVLLSFYPNSPATLKLPEATPSDIQAEFREAELCASVGAYRAAAALFRSALEKVLKVNGYVKQGNQLRDLQAKIDEAAKDGAITEARRKRAHDEIRTLGNDVLHDVWRVVGEDEVEFAHVYTQRIIEDFYDSRAEVEKALIEKGRMQPSSDLSNKS